MASNQAQGLPQQRPRAKSGFSFRSNHSRKSSSGSNKIDTHETHLEKEQKRLHSKADPSMAITEAEPSAVALDKSSLAPIRAIQHRDAQGNPIADPDRSNPTRSRWERPLDTIRAFEAAIDDSGDTASNYNRRSSYYGGTQVAQDEKPRYPQNSYYGGRSQSYRPESTYTDSRYGGQNRPESYYNGNDAGPSNGYLPNRARYPRTASEPHFNNGHSQVYPGPGNQQSYENVNTASGSGGSDPAGYSTDPSSENSSVDRITALPPKEPQETYGFSGFGNTPQFAAPGNGAMQQPMQGNGYPNQGPPPPSKDVGPRVPMKLGNSTGNAGSPPVQRPGAEEKRKSWFSKRFSKS